MEETQLKKSRGYAPAPAKPPFFDRSLQLMGGSNPYGEPFLKVGWSLDLRTFRNGNKEAIKYPGWACWVLERWMPPTMFEPKWDWDAQRYAYRNGKRVDVLGEFPSRGIYGMVTPLANPDGSYLPLDSDVLLWIDMNKESFHHRKPNIYESAANYQKYQEDMQREEDQMWANSEAETADFDDYIAKNQDHINRNPAFSMNLVSAPKRTLWTPEGEKTI